MKLNLRDLCKEVEIILEQAGFSTDLYIIKINDDNVEVMFDEKEAVDYFRGDFEYSSLNKDCIFEYKKDGKRHAAYIYPW